MVMKHAVHILSTAPGDLVALLGLSAYRSLLSCLSSLQLSLALVLRASMEDPCIAVSFVMKHELK